MTCELGDQHHLVTATNEICHPCLTQHMRREAEPSTRTDSPNDAIDRPRRETPAPGGGEQRPLAHDGVPDSVRAAKRQRTPLCGS